MFTWQDTKSERKCECGYLPKTSFVGLKTLYFEVYDTVSVFNSSNVTKCKLYNKLEMEIGKFTVLSTKQMD